MKLSNNLSLNEVLISRTAKRLGLSNEPTKQHLDNLKDISVSVFQPLRDFFDTPIHVSSGYRSYELNKAIRGSKTSQHMKGEALDLDADYYDTITNAQIFYYIKNHLVFDQLIWEFGDDNNPNWVHVSFSRGNNRNKVMKAIKRDGKTVYELF
tara:strand:+ start:230 stop:688 length:459 start_codon:yes stop_codon:yes gene_type:complete